MGDEHQQEAATAPAVEEMSYTDASDELDAIVRFFEDRDVDVDQLVGRLVRATAIIEELDKRLRRTRVQVEQLVPRLNTVLAANEEPDRDQPDREGDGELGDPVAGDRVAGDRVVGDVGHGTPTDAADGTDAAALF